MTTHDTSELQTFIVQLGAALNDSGQPVQSVQEQLMSVARAYGVGAARISAFPTYMIVSMGQGEPATLELTVSLATFPRLDQIAALDDLVRTAARGAITPWEGLVRLDEIRVLRPRFGRAQTIRRAVRHVALGPERLRPRSLTVDVARAVGLVWRQVALDRQDRSQSALRVSGSGSRVQKAGSRSSGQVMQCDPPRPRPSSKPSMVMTSMPALRSAVLVPVLRS